MRRSTVLASALALPLLAFSPLALFPGAPAPALISVAHADDYQPWQGPYNSPTPGQPGDVQQLVKQLRQLIAKAEKAKAADPKFLRDLKNLTDSYDNPWPNQIFFDNFSNGQYPDNRRWNVSAGNWRIVTQPSPGLATRVNTQQSGQYGNNNQNVLNGLLGALIAPQGNNQSQNQQGNGYAGISAPVAIPNAFNLHIEFSASHDAQRLDMGMYRNNSDGGYFLSYMPTAPRGFQLTVVVPGQQSRLLALTAASINLNGQGTHAVDWKRDRDGRMIVALDGQEIMNVTDTSLRKPFDGFAMGNSGGFYIIRSVAISGRNY
jgi:hypothetical protein